MHDVRPVEAGQRVDVEQGVVVAKLVAQELVAGVLRHGDEVASDGADIAAAGASVHRLHVVDVDPPGVLPDVALEVGLHAAVEVEVGARVRIARGILHREGREAHWNGQSGVSAIQMNPSLH